MIDRLCLQGARTVLSGLPQGRIPSDTRDRHAALEPMLRAVWYAALSGGRTFPEVTAQLRLAADLDEAAPGHPPDAVAALPSTASSADRPTALREIADHVEGWRSGFVAKLADATPTRDELLLRYPRLKQVLTGCPGRDAGPPGRCDGDALPPGKAGQALVDASHPHCLWTLPGVAAECRQALVSFTTEEALEDFFGQEKVSGPTASSWTASLAALIETIAGHMRQYHPPVWRPAARTPAVSVHGASEFSGAATVLSAFHGTGIPLDIAERHALADPMIRALAYASQGGGRTTCEVAAQLRRAAELFETDPANLPYGLESLPRTASAGEQPAALREIAERTASRPAGGAARHGAVTPTGLELLQRFPRLVGMLELYFGQDGVAYEAFEADDAPEEPTDRQLIQVYVDTVHGSTAMCPWEFPALAGECQEALVVFQTQEALRRFLLVEQALGGGSGGWAEWLTLIMEMTAEHLRAHHPPVWQGRTVS